MKGSGPPPSEFTSRLAWLRTHAGLLAWVGLGLLLPMWLASQIIANVLAQHPMPMDTVWPHWMHAHAHPVLDVLMRTISVCGSFKVVDPLGLVLVAVLCFRRRWADAEFLVLSVGGAQLVNHALKDFFQRARPDLWISSFPETSYSFPSGHAMQSLALGAAVAVLAWPTRWRWPALIAAGLFAGSVGLSRIYLGVHFPSDVLAGWCVTAVWVSGLCLLLRLKRPVPAAPSV